MALEGPSTHLDGALEDAFIPSALAVAAAYLVEAEQVRVDGVVVCVHLVHVSHNLR